MARMYQDDVKLTAYRGRDERWRIARLQRVIGYLQALMDKDGDSPFFMKIKRLHDRKGSLAVWWKKQPTKMEKRFIEEAWGSAIGDGNKDNVEHEIAKHK